MNETIAIFGAAGAVGANLGAELLLRKQEFIAVGRSRERLDRMFGANPFCTPRVADLSSPEGAAAACRDVDTIVYTVGVPYDRFALHPELMQRTVDAALRAGVQKLLVISSVYSYGIPQTDKVAESHPREPHTRKGRYRKEQEDIALEAGRGRRMKTMVLHLPDFLGPYAPQSLARTIVDAAIAGKTANWLGDPDIPHEFVYLPDAAPVIADLLKSPAGWGERYNLAGQGAITGTEFIRQVHQAANRKPRFRTAGKGMLRVMGLFSPLMRELVEMQYLMETPVLLDDRKLRGLVGEFPRTPYEDAILRTVVSAQMEAKKAPN